jgi:hypothetical protein
MRTNHWIAEGWRDHFILSGELTVAGERATLYRGVERGRFVRVARGAYLPAEDWRELNGEQRHLSRMRAIALTHPGSVFSHLSAAIAWRLPIVGRLPEIPHLVADPASGGRSKNGFVRHCVGIPEDVVTIDGLQVTTLARTLIDVAASSDMAVGVAAGDFALRATDPSDSGVLLARTTVQELGAELAALPVSSGAARGRRAIEFVDGRSGSPGESLSRVVIHQLGFPAPELQARFDDARGLVGFVDFWWPDASVTGEFDGHEKYLREDLLGGRTTGEALIAEKAREDRLRALGHRVARWDWATARAPQQLRARLLAAGLRAAGSQSRRKVAARVQLSGA